MRYNPGNQFCVNMIGTKEIRDYQLTNSIATDFQFAHPPQGRGTERGPMLEQTNTPVRC